MNGYHTVALNSSCHFRERFKHTKQTSRVHCYISDHLLLWPWNQLDVFFKFEKCTDVTAFLQSHQNLWIWFHGLPTPRPPPKSGSAFLASAWSSLSSRCDVNCFLWRPAVTTTIMEQGLLRSMWPRQWNKHNDCSMRTISELKLWYDEHSPVEGEVGQQTSEILSTGPSQS